MRISSVVVGATAAPGAEPLMCGPPAAANIELAAKAGGVSEPIPIAVSALLLPRHADRQPAAIGVPGSKEAKVN